MALSALPSCACHLQQSRDWKAKLEQTLSCWTVKGEHVAGKHVTGTSAVNREPQRGLSVWAAETLTPELGFC